MTDGNGHDTAPVPRRNQEYPSEVYDRAFHLWVSEAGRSHARTARLLAAERPEGERTPDSDTVGYWAHRDNWHARAYKRFTADRLFADLWNDQRVVALINLQAVNEKIANVLLHTPDDDPRHLGALVRAAELYAKQTGNLPNIATTVPPDQPPPPADEDVIDVDFSTMTPAERDAKRRALAERSQDRIRRAARPRRGKH